MFPNLIIRPSAVVVVEAPLQDGLGLVYMSGRDGGFAYAELHPPGIFYHPKESLTRTNLLGHQVEFITCSVLRISYAPVGFDTLAFIEHSF